MFEFLHFYNLNGLHIELLLNLATPNVLISRFNPSIPTYIFQLMKKREKNIFILIFSLFQWHFAMKVFLERLYRHPFNFFLVFSVVILPSRVRQGIAHVTLFNTNCKASYSLGFTYNLCGNCSISDLFLFLSKLWFPSPMLIWTALIKTFEVACHTWTLSLHLQVSLEKRDVKTVEGKA